MSHRWRISISRAVAIALLPVALAGCHVYAVPYFDLFVSVVNRAPATSTVTITGTAHYTLTVHSCSASSVGLIRGQYHVAVAGGAHPAERDVTVAAISGSAPQRVILIERDGSVDWDSTADPNTKAC